MLAYRLELQGHDRAEIAEILQIPGTQLPALIRAAKEQLAEFSQEKTEADLNWAMARRNFMVVQLWAELADIAMDPAYDAKERAAIASARKGYYQLIQDNMSQQETMAGLKRGETPDIVTNNVLMVQMPDGSKKTVEDLSPEERDTVINGIYDEIDDLEADLPQPELQMLPPMDIDTE